MHLPLCACQLLHIGWLQEFLSAVRTGYGSHSPVAGKRWPLLRLQLHLGRENWRRTADS
ncbi:hypothetical protein D3C76_1610490 [compost metagenome]